MKKLLTTICASLLLLTVVGCSDATSNVNDDSKALITVGDEEITKGNVYDGLISLGNVAPVSSALNEAIAAKAVKTSKTIKEEANASLKTLKESNKDWDAYLKSKGFKKEKELLTSLINQAKETRLTSQYVEDKYEDLALRFELRQLQIVTVTDEAKINDAMNAAKKEDMSAVATNYGDTTTYKGTTGTYTNKSGLPTSVWKKVLATKDNKLISKPIFDTPTNTFYIVKVVSSKTNKFKKDGISTLSSLSATNDDGLTMAEEAYKFFLNKFDYSIHDTTVYSALLNESQKYER